MRAKEFTASSETKDRFTEMFSKFLPLAMHYIGLKDLPKMEFKVRIETTGQPTFGMYVNGEKTLHVALANRHPNDILRTIAHELTHYKQDTQHELDDTSGTTGSPAENEANAVAGIVMRHFNKKYPEYLNDRPVIAESLQLDELDVSKTLGFVKKAHTGQQYGDKPYWNHPKSVAATGKQFFGSKFGPDAIKVALLHDVVEDTPYKLEQLAKMGYSPMVVQAVQLLTKNKALSYADNIRAIINSGNRLAMMVKYADNYQNFTGDKSSWDPARAAHSQKKYLASLNMLGDKLGISKHL